MRIALLLSFVLAAPAAAFTQTAPAQTPPRAGAPAPPTAGAPAQTPPRTGGPAPAPARPARPRAAAPATTRSGMAITASNPSGGTLENIHVEVTGPMSRSGDTNAAGQVNFPGLPAGTYRLRFTGDQVVTFEREAVLAGGRVTSVQVTLTPAEAARREVAAPQPSAPAAPAAGPIGSPQWGSLTDLAKRAQQSKPPRREVVLACSGTSRSELLVLTEDQAQRVYDEAESTYYVLDGQGTVTIGDRPGAVTDGSFVAVPRGMPFTIARRGNKPLVMLWVLSGAPCEEAR